MEFLVTHTLRTKSCSHTFHLLNEERCVVAEIITAHRTHVNSVVITLEMMTTTTNTMIMMLMMMMVVVVVIMVITTVIKAKFPGSNYLGHDTSLSV